MMPVRIEGANRTFKAPDGVTKQECGDLQVRVERFTMGGKDCFAFTSAWQPTPEEMVLLNAGASIHLTLIGQSHQPIAIKVGPVPK